MSQEINQKELPQIEKCALWRKTSKKGNAYLTGTAEVSGQIYRLVVFENPFKAENEKRPDYEFDITKQ